MRNVFKVISFTFCIILSGSVYAAPTGAPTHCTQLEQQKCMSTCESLTFFNSAHKKGLCNINNTTLKGVCTCIKY